MKKLTLLLIMMVLLAACGGTETTVSPTDEPAVEDTAVSTDTPAEEAATEVDDGAEETAVSATDGLDISYFFDGALEEEATIEDCTLSDGTETTCYSITIAGYPADYDVGPFCPPDN